MSIKFTERDKLNLSDVNKEVLQQWDAEDVFHLSMSEREGCPSFIFYEGPPSANGHPGIHHVLARSIKDTFCRFKTMKGFLVKRKAGWDTHGLPVELGVEKELGITKEDIGKSISIEEYNRKCRENVMMYTSEWADLSHKMGYWVDMEHPYITYDNKYIETLWWLLKQLYQKDLLYKGYTIQPYSPAAGTGLSSHELNQPGCYRDVKDTTVTAQFKTIQNSKFKIPRLCLSTFWLGRQPLGLCPRILPFALGQRLTMLPLRATIPIVARRLSTSWQRLASLHTSKQRKARSLRFCGEERVLTLSA